jgi:hypothetical protein
MMHVHAQEKPGTGAFRTVLASVQRIPWFALVVLLPIAVIEAVTARVDLYTGFVLSIALLVVLVVRGSLAPDQDTRRLTLALTLVPIIRLLALGMPVGQLPQFTWYPLMALIVWGATRFVAWQLDLPRHRVELRLERGNLPYHLGLLIGGTCLAAVPVVWFTLPVMGTMLSWWALLMVLVVLFLCTGFIEELVFRGVLQSAVSSHSAVWGVVYPALMFGLLYSGLGPWSTVLFLVLMGVIFGAIVQSGGALIDVVFLHGLTRLVALGMLVALPVNTGGSLVGMVCGVAGMSSTPVLSEPSVSLTTILDTVATIITPVPLEVANGLHPTVTLVLLALLALKELLATNKRSAWMQRLSSGLTLAIIPLLVIFITGFGARLIYTGV